MNFEKAFKLMKAGEKVKLTTWSGYWYWDNEKKNYYDPYQIWRRIRYYTDR